MLGQLPVGQYLGFVMIMIWHAGPYQPSQLVSGYHLSGRVWFQQELATHEKSIQQKFQICAFLFQFTATKNPPHQLGSASFYCKIRPCLSLNHFLWCKTMPSLNLNGNVKLKLNRYFLCNCIMQTSLYANRTKGQLKLGFIINWSGTDETERNLFWM